jgi:hypothetical protein
MRAPKTWIKPQQVWNGLKEEERYKMFHQKIYSAQKSKRSPPEVSRTIKRCVKALKKIDIERGKTLWPRKSLKRRVRRLLKILKKMEEKGRNHGHQGDLQELIRRVDAYYKLLSCQVKAIPDSDYSWYETELLNRFDAVCEAFQRNFHENQECEVCSLWTGCCLTLKEGFVDEETRKRNYKPKNPNPPSPVVSDSFPPCGIPNGSEIVVAEPEQEQQQELNLELERDINNESHNVDQLLNLDLFQNEVDSLCTSQEDPQKINPPLIENQSFLQDMNQDLAQFWDPLLFELTANYLGPLFNGDFLQDFEMLKK